MGLATLRDNQLIRLRGRILKLIGRFPDGDWHLVDIGSGLIDKQPEDVLWAQYEKRELVFICESEATSRATDKKIQPLLTEEATLAPPLAAEEDKRKIAHNKWKYVQATRGLTIAQIGSARVELREKIGWPVNPPHPNSIRNWQIKAEDSIDPVSALIDRDDLKGRHGDRYNAELMDLLREVRDKDYLRTNPRIRVSEAIQRVQDKVRIRNGQHPKSDHWPIPGRRAFQKVVDELPQIEVFAKRYGSDAALNRYRTSLGGIKALRPLDRCEVDHTPLSVILLDEDFVPWGRASDSLALDVRCRMPLGTYWGPETPSVVALARCIRHSVKPKTEFMKNFPNVKGQWNAFGVASVYNVDNGMEEWSQALQNAMSELGGSVLEFGARKTPWHKPHVERYFRTQDLGLIHTLPGTTMENVLKRCKFNPKKDFLIRRSVFDRIRMKWLVDVYMNEKQECLGHESPNEVWTKLVQGIDQYVPSRTILLEQLFLRKVDGRVLDHEGIEYDCLVYNSMDLGALRSQRGAVLRVSIYVSDEDLGHIQVVVPDSDIRIRVPCLTMDYAKGLTRWQHKKCKEMKRALKSDGRELTLAEAREEIRKEIANEMQEFRLANRKRRSRFEESADAGYWGHNSESSPQKEKSEESRCDSVNAADAKPRLMRSPDREIPSFDSFVASAKEAFS